MQAAKPTQQKRICAAGKRSGLQTDETLGLANK
jgi:hypothetical protein